MIYDASSGFWMDANGASFIKNEFDPNNPVFLSVSSSCWTGVHLQKTYTLHWPNSLDPQLRERLGDVLKDRMRRLAPSALDKYRQLVDFIARLKFAGRTLQTEDFLDGEKVRALWESMPSDLRPHLRSLIPDLIEAINPHTAHAMSLLLKDWKANRKLAWRRSVLEWDPQEGSMTSAELETLRFHLKPPKRETIQDNFARLFLRLSLTTLRRPSQLTSIRSDGLRRITTSVGTTVDIRVPTAKGQAGREPPWLPIPTDLADDIDEYRDRSAIARASAASEVLLPIALNIDMVRSEYDESVLSVVAPNGHQATVAVQQWVRKKKIISPRTGELLHINLRRVRHTGATHLAMQGYPLDLIQDILEHDSPESTRHYVDAVGAEYLPAFESADRNLGGRFSMLRDVWFNGKVVDRSEAPNRPIIIPDAQAPAVVGACGKGGACSVHPLFSCYSCEHFLAFRDANHQRVLDFVEAEYLRWRAVEASASRSKAIKDFDRVAAGVRDVINLIDHEGANGDR